MIHTFTIESSKGIHKPPRWACETLNTDVQENAATTVGVMFDGSLYAQSLNWGTKTVSVSGGGRLAPNLDDLPMGELVKLHSASTTSMQLPASIPVTFHASVAGHSAPAGYIYAALDIEEFAEAIPCRAETYYEPMLSALFASTGPNGEEVLEVYNGDVARVGNVAYSLVPIEREALMVSFFPIYEGYLTKPARVSTDNNQGMHSWSFELICSTARPGDGI